MKKRILGKTDIQIASLVFGGNVLGYEKLLKAGKIRHIGASNYSVQQLKGAKKSQ